MKNVIVTIAEILLGIFLFVLIFGKGESSLKNKSDDIFNKVIIEVLEMENDLEVDQGTP